VSVRDGESERSVRVASPEGELDISTVDIVDEVLRSVPVTDHMIVDLSRVSFVDSVTLSRFVRASRRHEAAGSRVVLADAHGAVRRVLALTRLDHVLPYADDLDSARDLVASPGNE
jgi:anti-anti-sigma factor